MARTPLTISKDNSQMGRKYLKHNCNRDIPNVKKKLLKFEGKIQNIWEALQLNTKKSNNVILKST